jgi:hypothetical protein
MKKFVYLILAFSIFLVSCTKEKKVYTRISVIKEIRKDLKEAKQLRRAGELSSSAKVITSLGNKILDEYPSKTMYREYVSKVLGFLNRIGRLCRDKELEIKNESTRPEDAKKYTDFSNNIDSLSSKIRKRLPLIELMIQKRKLMAHKDEPVVVVSKDPKDIKNPKDPKDPKDVVVTKDGTKTEPAATDEIRELAVFTFQAKDGLGKLAKKYSKHIFKIANNDTNFMLHRKQDYEEMKLLFCEEEDEIKDCFKKINKKINAEVLFAGVVSKGSAGIEILAYIYSNGNLNTSTVYLNKNASKSTLVDDLKKFWKKIFK